MDPRTCDHCGQEIEEGDGIRHRRRLFCSDECCEAFEDEFLTSGEPDALDLDEDLVELDPLADDDLDTLEEEADGLDPLDDDDF